MKNRNHVRSNANILSNDVTTAGIQDSAGTVTVERAGDEKTAVTVNGIPGTWEMVSENGQLGCRFKSHDGTISFVVDIHGEGAELGAGALREA